MGAPEAFTQTTDVGHWVAGAPYRGENPRAQTVWNPTTGQPARQVLPSLLVRLIGEAPAGASGSSPTLTVDIFGAGLLFLRWNIVLTLAIGAFIVMVMKGPAYVADAYPLDDADGADAQAQAGRS